MLQQGLRRRVEEANINIKNDPWFPKPSTFKVRSRDGLQSTLVCDLIDLVLNDWDVNLVSSGFHKDDVALILSIPLSRTGHCDSLVWHYNANGEYSVKSEYGVAVSLMDNGALGKKGRGMPSDNQKNPQVWNQIWKLLVPNKNKILIWRCCNHALAVRRNLKRRQMRIDNVCGVCGKIDKSENHIFFQCISSHLFLFCSPLNLNSLSLAANNFLETWENICK